MRLQAQQHIAAIGGRQQHRVMPLQLPGCFAEVPGRQGRAVRADQQNLLSPWLLRFPGSGDPRHGARHAGAQVPLSLIAACHTGGDWRVAPGRVAGRRAHAKFHAVNVADGQGRHRLGQRVRQHATRQLRGADSAQKGDQPGFDVSGLGCLGKNHETG